MDKAKIKNLLEEIEHELSTLKGLDVTDKATKDAWQNMEELLQKIDKAKLSCVDNTGIPKQELHTEPYIPERDSDY